MVTAGSELTPGTSIDRRYLIQCTLGRGGFGRTYLAADERRFNELCVLKEFVPGNQTDPVVAQKLRELFQREAAILHKLDHPQIPKFFAGFEEHGRLFIAQEYIDGKTYWRMLQERQRRGEVFSQPEVIRWLWDLLRVLDYLHQQGIVHRDISPDNIMLPRGSQMPILIDFGVVKQVLPHLHMTDPSDPDGLIQASVSVGKFGYAPYEQIRMGQCSPRSDLYALAVTAVVLLTGKPPNLLMDAKTLEWQWQRQVRLDPGFSTLLATMMADRPQDRFGSARAVLQALHPLYLPVRILPSPRTIKPRRRGTETQPVFTESGLVNGRATQADLFSEATGFTAGAELGWAERVGQAQIADSQAGHPHLGQSHLQPSAESEAAVETYLDLSPIGHTVAMPDSPTQIEPLDTTQIEPTVPGAIVVVPQPELLWPAAARTLEPRLSLRSLLSLVRAVVLRSPQDQLGSVKQLRFSFKQIAVWGILAVLPVGGAVVGIRSPHINSLCSALGNCVGQNLQERYQQAIEQADSAGLLSTSARSVNDLQQARQRLADSIAQLYAFSGDLKVHASTHAILPRYQTLLQRLDQTLDQETRAAQLLNRAEAEAQRAAEQTNLAKTYPQYQSAQVEWRRALATLDAVPDNTFVSRQATARVQEYKVRLDAVGVKLAALKPPTATKTAAPAPVASRRSSPSQNAVQVSVVAAPSPAASVTSAAPKRSGATAGSRSPARPAQPAPAARPPATPAARSQTRATPSRQTARRPSAARSVRSSPPVQPPSTSPLEVERQWVAGSVLTSATQTLQDVSIWIDGARTEADGKFVANLWIQNRSHHGFGFVPLYAESRDSSGQTVRSRVLFTGNAGTMLEPGGALSGQIYLLDRASGTTRLTLVVQESTNGNRTFRIPF